MSDFSEEEINETINKETKIVKNKKAITDKQRLARLENLRKGRLTRLAKIEENKKLKIDNEDVQKQISKVSQKVSIDYESNSSSSESSESEEEELVLTTRKKKQVEQHSNKSHRAESSISNSKNEIQELKNMIMKMSRDKKKPRKQNTYINIPPSTPIVAPTPVNGGSNGSYSDFYKTRILNLKL
jgi:hypothetical protein